MIYESTDFDGIGGSASSAQDNIQFGIERFLVNSTTPPSSSSFSREFLGVEAYLQAHSRANWGTYCLSYAFTSRDFDNGVLGLAFVASREREGVCVCVYFVCMCVVCVQCICVHVCVFVLNKGS